MAGEVWEVVGGSDKCGILVRSGQDTSSAEESTRLSTGSLVKELALSGARLHYELLEGKGPARGWVSIQIKGKDLLVKKGMDLSTALVHSDKSKGKGWSASGDKLGQLPTGLEPVVRSKKLPGFKQLPPILQNSLPPPKLRHPRLRVIVIPGTADPYSDAWHPFELDAPEYVEVAVYEWPGIGLRRKDPFLSTLDDMGADAFDVLSDALSSGPFVFIAHSLGVPVMVHVAERAKRELGVEPLAAFVLDHGAPHLAPLSEYGQEKFKDKDYYTKYWSYTSIYQAKLQHGPRAMEPAAEALWRAHLYENDTRPIGFYMFRCPLIIMVAKQMWGPESLALAGLPCDIMEERKLITRNGLGYDFIDPDDFEAWSAWGDAVTVEHVDCDHAAIRTHDVFKVRFWHEVETVIKRYGGT